MAQKTALLFAAVVAFLVFFLDLATGTGLAQDKLTDEQCLEFYKMLQAHVQQFPELVPNQRKTGAKYKKIWLNKTPLRIYGRVYDAFTFKTPKETGELVWSFLPASNNVSWYIIPASGSMTGFSKFEQLRLPKDIDNVGAKSNVIIFQRLAAKELKPDTMYIMWFQFSNAIPAPIPISLNILKKQDLPFREVFSFYDQLSPQRR